MLQTWGPAESSACDYRDQVKTSKHIYEALDKALTKQFFNKSPRQPW